MIQHIVNVSGGKDSTAVYLLALESGRPFRAVFADTGNEHEAVYEYISQLHIRTGGPAVETVRADFTADLARHQSYILREWPKQGISQWKIDRAAALNVSTGNQYLDLCILKGRFPSRMAQFCTEELKVLPITEQIILPALRVGPVLQWLGIRADESANRAKQPKFNRHDSGSYLWRPIFRWTVADVWAQHRKHALGRNPLYDMGMTRVGCMPCVNCSKGELRSIAELYPNHIDRIREWERIVSEVSKLNSATFFAAGTVSRDKKTKSYRKIDKMVEWSRTKRGGEVSEPSGGGCNSDMAVCERGQ